MKCREWAEEHWAGVTLLVSVTGAVAISVAIIVCFNVLLTR